MLKKSLVLLLAVALILCLQTPILSVDNADNGNRISASGDYCMAILDDDSLWGWGFDGGVHLGLRFSEEKIIHTPTKIMDECRSVVAGWGTTLVIKNDNTLWAWGDNMPGVGEGRITYAISPEKIMDNVKDAACGNWFVLAVKTDGSLWAWGDNSGVRFDPTKILRDKKNLFLIMPVVKPMKIMDGVAKVSADNGSYCVLKKDGTLLSCGGGVSSDKKIKIGNMNYYVISTGVKDMNLGTGVLYYIKTNGSLWGLGKKAYEDFNVAKYNLNKSNSYDRVPFKIMDNVKSVEANSTLTPIALKKDGTFLTWGVKGLIDMNFSENTSDILNAYSKNKTLVLMDDVREIDSSEAMYLATKNDGTIWTWGVITFGQEGDASSVSPTFRTTDFEQLDFSDQENILFTDATQPDKTLAGFVNESTEMPEYDAVYKPNWNCKYWKEAGFEMKGFHTTQVGNKVYGYDLFNSLCLVGTIDGNRLKGYISNGIFEIRLSPDGKTFTGFTYLNSAADPANWIGTR